MPTLAADFVIGSYHPLKSSGTMGQCEKAILWAIFEVTSRWRYFAIFQETCVRDKSWTVTAGAEYKCKVVTARP